MGKRRSAAKAVVKRRQLMGKTFDCPFCDHKDTIEVKIDLKQKIGTMKCRVCDSSNYTTTIRAADGPTDVFHEFIDSVHEVNEPQNEEERRGGSEPSSVPGGARGLEKDILGIFEREQEEKDADADLEEEGLDLTEMSQGPPRKKQKTEVRAKAEEQEVGGEYEEEDEDEDDLLQDANGDNDLLPGEGEDPEADLELAGPVDDLGSESD